MELKEFNFASAFLKYSFLHFASEASWFFAQEETLISAKYDF
jgi:hypothetical protein